MKECATHLEVLALTFWLSYETIPSAVIDRKSEILAASRQRMVVLCLSLPRCLYPSEKVVGFQYRINPNRFSFVGLMPVQEILKFQPGQIPWDKPSQSEPEVSDGAYGLWRPSSKIGENSTS